MAPVSVSIFAADPLTVIGLACYLDARPDLVLRNVRSAENTHVDVAIVVLDHPETDPAVLRRVALEGAGAPVLLIAEERAAAPLISTARYNVKRLLAPASATPERVLHDVLCTAAGERRATGDRTGTSSGSPADWEAAWSAEEIKLVHLIAEGMPTAEIARQLSYSIRTVEGILHRLTTRHHLRNRCHLIAFALRSGVIR